MFVFNEVLAISDYTLARAGSLSSDQERFNAWRTIDGVTLDPLGDLQQLETMIRGLFRRDFFLDYLRYFVLFEEDGNVKKIAGYHQFHAVRAVVQSVIQASRPGGSRKGGVVWHTQGSGKSIEMTCLAGHLMMAPEMQNPTIVVVTDRNDLDGQLFETFSGASDLLREKPARVETCPDLRTKLDNRHGKFVLFEFVFKINKCRVGTHLCPRGLQTAWADDKTVCPPYDFSRTNLPWDNRPSGGIIFTTIQKFSPFEDEDSFPILSERQNIVVICDEAHRSQYGFKARLHPVGRVSPQGVTRHDADELSGYAALSYPLGQTRPTSLQAEDASSVMGTVLNTAMRYGYAYYLREALPNATFVAFTGTPISTEDKDTRAVFGDYVHIYDIEQAVKDGATVPIYYESRLAKLELNPEELPLIDDEVAELTEDDEESTKTQTLRRWAALEKIVGAPPRVQKVAEDLVRHFENRTAAMDGKAMVVAMSREICVHLYNAIVAIRPDWHDEDPEKGAIKIVMTGSASDKALLKPHIYTKELKKRMEKRFKDPSDPLKMVIVRDMWLTGFDAPCVHTMYVDKPMKSHNLIQAIARVNRVFKDKPGGLVVDYIGIATELKQALMEYTGSKGKGRPTINAEEALDILIEKVSTLRGMMHGFEYGQFRTKALSLLAGAANHILGQDEGKQRFADQVLSASKAFALCCTLDKANELGLSADELSFYDALETNESSVRELGDSVLKEIARQLTKFLCNNLSVDWSVRETVRAKMRAQIKLILKRHKYPPDLEARAVDLVLKQAEALSEVWM